MSESSIIRLSDADLDHVSAGFLNFAGSATIQSQINSALLSTAAQGGSQSSNTNNNSGTQVALILQL